MSIVEKLFGGDASKNGRAPANSTDYIDLSDYAAMEKTEGAASTYVRVAELKKLDDLKQFSSYIYDGNVLILDFRPVQGDEILLRRLTNELRKIAADTGGDIAGLGEHHILLTPTGIKVDRRKVSAVKAEDAETPSVRTPRGAPAAEPTTTFTPAPAASGAPPARANGRRGTMNGR